MRRRLKIIVTLLAIIILAGAFTYWYAFLKPHKNILKAKPDYELTATDLFNEFNKNETEANEKYLGKVIQVNGQIVSVDTNPPVSIILKDDFFGINCYLDSSFVAENQSLLDNLNSGKTITIKGQCDGMLNEVIITRAVIVVSSIK